MRKGLVREKDGNGGFGEVGVVSLCGCGCGEVGLGVRRWVWGCGCGEVVCVER